MKIPCSFFNLRGQQLIHSLTFVSMLLLLGVQSFAANHKGKYYSPQQSTYVEWISENNKTVLRSTIKGVEFISEIGINLDDKEYLFGGKLKMEQQSKPGELPLIYRFSSAKSPVKIEIAVLENAVAFRYSSDIGKGMIVKSEASSFSLPEKSKVYYFERKNHWKLQSYAGTWESCGVEELPRISGSNPVQGLPLVFQLPDNRFAVATEVNLQNYSGLRWHAGTPFSIKANFTEGKKGFMLSTALCTPWRVMFVADNLNELVNQTVVRQLSPVPDKKLYAKIDYIVPGKSVWRWFSRGTGNPEEERQFVDYAHQLGFTYSIIDEGYTKWEGDYWQQLRMLADYADKKDVKLILWNHSNTISDPADDYLQMRTWLDRVKSAGMAGVKVDFMNSESKFFIDFDIKLLQECAKRQLVVNFHGCQQPAGEAYTYPNELTREGIRGMELNKMSEGPIPSYHNALLPFTRLAVGHGDYTPLSFVNPGNTTFAHQLATLVAFNSPMQVIAEDPHVLMHEPTVTPALDLIKAVPTVWDETIVLPQTELGKTAVVARRSGNNWFIYVLNGTNDTRDVRIDLSAIVSDFPHFEASLFVDDLKAEKVKIEMETHRSSPLKQDPVVPFKKIVKAAESNYNIILAAHGGAVLWLRKKK
jgi:alpha-glucosidase